MRNKQKEQSSSDSFGKHDFWIITGDLMSGLVFLFIIMLTLSFVTFSKERVLQINTTKELKSADKTRKKILTDLKDRLKGDDLTVQILPKQGVLRLFNEKGISFSEAEDSPTETSFKNIARLARALKEVLPCYSIQKSSGSAPSIFNEHQHKIDARPSWCDLDKENDVNFESQQAYQCDKDNYPRKVETLLIEGHTDSLPLRLQIKHVDNLALSAARAANVMRLLQKCEPSLGYLVNSEDTSLLSVSGYSFLRPAFPLKPDDSKNRRIDLRFIMENIKDVAIEEDQEPKREKISARRKRVDIKKFLN